MNYQTVIDIYSTHNTEDIHFIREVVRHWDKAEIDVLLQAFRNNGWTVEYQNTGCVMLITWDRGTRMGWYLYSEKGFKQWV